MSDTFEIVCSNKGAHTSKVICLFVKLADGRWHEEPDNTFYAAKGGSHQVIRERCGKLGPDGNVWYTFPCLTCRRIEGPMLSAALAPIVAQKVAQGRRVIDISGGDEPL